MFLLKERILQLFVNRESVKNIQLFQSKNLKLLIQMVNIYLFVGAGDAFCGGFLAQFIQGQSLDVCISAGNYLANIVIQRSGPTYPRTECKWIA